jgi:hypothetical protein
MKLILGKYGEFLTEIPEVFLKIIVKLKSLDVTGCQKKY